MLSWAVAVTVVAAVTGGRTIAIPFGRGAWTPDGADARWAAHAPTGVETNADFLRAPEPGQDRAAWLRSTKELRHALLANNAPEVVHVRFQGVRAWIRLSSAVAADLRLRAGERLQLTFEARWIAGNPEIGFALDALDPMTGAWRGWSTIFAVTRIPTDGAWHAMTVDLTLPRFSADEALAVPIVGQDGTRDATPGQWELRSLTLRAPTSPERERAARRAAAAVAAARRGIDLSLYGRRDMAWSARNYACYFLFLYDRAFYDVTARRYRVDEFLARMDREFGGIDSVVLWHAYPRIGVDERNQFDFYRDMPGGIAGLRAVVDRFHAHGVRVTIDYNPWDTGTRREAETDSAALARLVRDLGADGIFLDTMSAAPADLRRCVDAVRRGVVFEPEGRPPLEQLGACTASWAQWPEQFPEPGVLLLRWLEPRHMQHQIRRWDRSHTDEIETAFFNGSGMLIWENVFGSWNGWREDDKALWRRAVAILRTYSEELTRGDWEPFVETGVPGLYANRWTLGRRTLTLYVNRSGRPVTLTMARTVRDLWSGAGPSTSVTIDRLGATLEGPLRRAAARHPLPGAPEGTRNAASEPAADACSALSPAPGDGPSASTPPSRSVEREVPAAEVRMLIRHERRECGCYADPGSPPERRDYFVFGTPFDEVITHDYTVRVKPFLIDETLVTNAQYEEFLRATGYRPADSTNFLKHWTCGRCPAELRDHPVVYVDIDDARAYAKWAGKRLPTEAEWQLAAQGTDGRKWPWGEAFDPARCNGWGAGTTPVHTYPDGRSPFGCFDMAGNVWQWTDSEVDDGHTRFVIIRGGSYFDAKGSIWYVHGGAQPLNAHTKFVRMAPGLDRCATIGFRCVRDRR